MEFSDVAILLTEDCNARCKMCCDSRGVVKGKTLSEKELELILSNIKEFDKINSIGITGGEPMLYPKLIDYIMTYDFGRDIKISIKSNGFWGNNSTKAEEFIKNIRINYPTYPYKVDKLI